MLKTFYAISYKIENYIHMYYLFNITLNKKVNISTTQIFFWQITKYSKLRQIHENYTQTECLKVENLQI